MSAQPESTNDESTPSMVDDDAEDEDLTLDAVVVEFVVFLVTDDLAVLLAAAIEDALVTEELAVVFEDAAVTGTEVSGLVTEVVVFELINIF